jgi:glycosyltransferase involved in cell wall biosynthesis
MAAADRPLFSVIIPTRNRSSLFAVALQSVLEQRLRDFEVIVVNDGSLEEHELRYRELTGSIPELVRVLSLAPTERGHGQSYALNFGASRARGRYLCFLDDDDQWTDPEHLGRAARAIAASPAQIDLLLANQRAFRDGVPVPEVIWIEDLEEHMRGTPDAAGAYTVTAAELLRCPAHCHLNTTIALRAFYLEIGGLDERVRYECDRDFFLRAIDRAQLIKFLPWIVSRHNIPDPAARMNMSTVESELSKRLFQLRVFDKAILFSKRPELRRYGMHQRTYILKHIATEAARIGQLDCAVYYARQALAARFTFAWLAGTAIFCLRRRFAARSGEGPPAVGSAGSGATAYRCPEGAGIGQCEERVNPPARLITPPSQ